MASQRPANVSDKLCRHLCQGYTGSAKFIISVTGYMETLRGVMRGIVRFVSQIPRIGDLQSVRRR